MTSEHHSLPHNPLDIHVLYPIFTKDKADRTPQDIELALKFLRELPFFTCMQNYDLDLDHLLIEFLDAMEFASLKQGKTIFNYRDKPTKFYIILKGNVDIYVPKTEEEREMEIKKFEEFIQKRAQNSPRKSVRRSVILDKGVICPRKSFQGDAAKLEIQQLESILSQCKSNEDHINFDALTLFPSYNLFSETCHLDLASKLKKAKTLGPGSYFGELALSMDCSRSAKVVAASELSVVTLCRLDYKRILHQFEMKFKEKINFFSKIIGVGREEAFAVAKFSYGFKERKYIFGQKVFKQGEMPHEVYIVKQGEVQVSIQTGSNKESKTDSTSRKKNLSLNQKLVKFGAYTLLGANEATVMKPYDTTVISSSNDTVLYVMPLQEYQNMQASYRTLCQKILTSHEKKLAYLKTRLDSMSSLAKKMAAEEESVKPSTAISKTPRVLTKQESLSIQYTEPINKEPKLTPLPKLQESQIKDLNLKASLQVSPRYSQTKLKHAGSLTSLVFDLPLGSPKKSVLGPFPTARGESINISSELTPQAQTAREKFTFGEFLKNSAINSPRTENIKLELRKQSNPTLSNVIQPIKDIKLKNIKSGSIGNLMKIQNKFELTHQKSFKSKARKNRPGTIGAARLHSEGDLPIIEKIPIDNNNIKMSNCSTLAYLKQKYTLTVREREETRGI